jgi:uncharacterized protein (TIGR03437 family)
MKLGAKIFFVHLAVVLGLIPFLLWGYATGPDAGHTGAPGDQTCAIAGCHLGPGNPTSGSGVEIEFPEGNRYTPGVKQRWTIRVTGAQSAVYGFQVSARLGSNERLGQAGSFTPVDANVQVLCQDNRPKGSGSCRAETPIEFAEHVLAGSSSSFTVEWTPPASDTGDVRVYVAGNAGNGNGMESGDRIFLNNYTLSPQASQPPLPAPQLRAETPVLQAFSGRPGLSSGTYLEIYGSNFTRNTRTWGGGDFTNNGTQAPTALDGVKVNVNGKPAFVYFISPNQINAQAPDDEALGNLNIEVETASGKSNVAVLNKTRVSPALLAPSAFNVGGKQYVVAQFQDFQTFVGRAGLIAGLNSRPARPGEVITIFAVGCGPTNPASPAGQVVSGLRSVSSPLQVTFGSTVAQAQAFMTPNAVGLCQLNITVPNVAGDSTGDIRLDATVDGVATGQTLFTTVQ